MEQEKRAKGIVGGMSSAVYTGLARYGEGRGREGGEGEGQEGERWGREVWKGERGWGLAVYTGLAR